MQEFHRATRKQRTLKLIVATLLLTYGNSVTRALIAFDRGLICILFWQSRDRVLLSLTAVCIKSLRIRPSSNFELFMYWTEYLYINVDPNDNSSTIDSIGLNSFHDVHGLQCLPVKISYSNLCIRFGTWKKSSTFETKSLPCRNSHVGHSNFKFLGLPWT